MEPLVYVGALAFLLAGCEGTQSALDPAGPQAARIRDLWWVFFNVSAAVFVLVVGFTLYVVVRRRPALDKGAHRAEIEPVQERRLARAVAVATGLTVVVLLGLLVASVATGRDLADLSSADAVTFEVTGHQWWWEIHYRDGAADRNFVTANELHIPVGRPVVLRVTSRDVIHSLWIPSLHGKRDLIPGHRSQIALRADLPGVYRGQCAELCGFQHAKMALLVVAEPEAQWNAWVEAQRAPAPEPASDLERRGRDVFLSGPCVLCHAVQGTLAGATVGPDLTHVAGRMTIVAGTLPNTPGHRAGWITNPQSIKPGTLMPANTLASEDLQALLAYLGSLR